MIINVDVISSTLLYFESTVKIALTVYVPAFVGAIVVVLFAESVYSNLTFVIPSGNISVSTPSFDNFTPWAVVLYVVVLFSNVYPVISTINLSASTTTKSLTIFSVFPEESFAVNVTWYVPGVVISIVSLISTVIISFELSVAVAANVGLGWPTFIV